MSGMLEQYSDQGKEVHVLHVGIGAFTTIIKNEESRGLLIALLLDAENNACIETELILYEGIEYHFHSHE